MLPIDSEYSKANSWHTDVTFVDRIPAISIPRAITLPPYGGTTVWANTALAYEQLHPSLKALTEKLWAVHSNLYDYAADRDEKRIGGIDVKQQAHREEFRHLEFETVRWNWRPGDIAIWDNPATQHYAVSDHDDIPRLLHRFTLAADVPMSVDGVRSSARKGDASGYSRVPAG